MGLRRTMLALWQNYANNEDINHRRIGLLLQLNSDVAETLDAYSPRYGYMSVPEPEATTLFENAMATSQLHTQLQEHFASMRLKVFNQTSKVHFALHGLMLCKHLHPALVWCFKGESFMRTSQRIWKSCLDGKTF